MTCGRVEQKKTRLDWLLLISSVNDVKVKDGNGGEEGSQFESAFAGGKDEKRIIVLEKASRGQNDNIMESRSLVSVVVWRGYGPNPFYNLHLLTRWLQQPEETQYLLHLCWSSLEVPRSGYCAHV